MKNQFKQLLREIHFYDRRNEQEYNENSNNIGLVKAVMVAGLYPNVIKVASGSSGKGGGRKGGKGGSLKLTTQNAESGQEEKVCATLVPKCSWRGLCCS